MCDQYDNRGCEIVDEFQLEITNLEMTIAELKLEIVEDLKKAIGYFKTINNYQDFNGVLKQCIWIEHLEKILNKTLIKKWEAK